MTPRTLRDGQRCEVWTAPADGGEPELAFVTAQTLFEAPNWLADGRLLLNGDGRLWFLAPDGGGPEPLPATGLPPVNNDHVPAPDGTAAFCSADDGHIYRVPLTGGAAERVTHDDGARHFLHGVSPDGGRLGYVEIHDGDGRRRGRLAVLDLADGTVARPDVGDGHCDGPEFTPDGAWILLNTESFGGGAGHAQLARVPAHGHGSLERLHESGRVDWFPHISPDGRHGAYVSFPSGTLGHPADVPVHVVLVDSSDWAAERRRIEVFGGQGTMNVNSWAPDSSRFAYVGYPIGDGLRSGA
ncbi:biopolymer transporter Tol [Sinomonas sp. R1AF57]|uniref:TolB family protein n=1 Tax=Sinomonas sp. R1AF57 TaxID=2020377 RepID=UPI000B5FA7EA|nr:biopolymer transporter Tol [Sinomonas sp. R1AF57]ASN50923.1 biopolymer transporter Tol [Sinomonas sp. R1AF57]